MTVIIVGLASIT